MRTKNQFGKELEEIELENNILAAYYNDLHLSFEFAEKQGIDQSSTEALENWVSDAGNFDIQIEV